MFKGFLFALFVILALAEPKIIFNKVHSSRLLFNPRSLGCWCSYQLYWWEPRFHYYVHSLQHWWGVCFLHSFSGLLSMERLTDFSPLVLPTTWPSMISGLLRVSITTVPIPSSSKRSLRMLSASPFPFPSGEKYEYNVTATPRQSGYLETARAQLSYLYIDEQEESHVHVRSFRLFSSSLECLLFYDWYSSHPSWGPVHQCY